MRDELNMKPSVAKKLNEKIRTLEAEVDELRGMHKVRELEKKVQVRCGWCCEEGVEGRVVLGYWDSCDYWDEGLVCVSSFSAWVGRGAAVRWPSCVWHTK